jgi:hypothetical protein
VVVATGHLIGAKWGKGSKDRKDQDKEISMQKFDVEQLKSALPEIKREHLISPALSQFAMLERPKFPYRRAMAEILEPFLRKGGVDIAKLDRMSMQNQEELRSNFRKQQSQAAKHAAAAAAAFRQGVENRRKALDLLATPFAPYIITLDRPVLVMETPHTELDKFIDWHISPLDNWIKVKVDTNAGSDSTQFGFYFMWQNDSDAYAVVNVNSSLILNGVCEVAADTGFFSGDTTTLYSSAYLSLIRWSGWGTDPSTGESMDGTLEPYYEQSQYQMVESMQVQGGGFFGDVAEDSRMFSFTPFDVSYNTFAIPGHAVAIFEVALSVNYGFADGGGISDTVLFDFADDTMNRSIQCPSVELEVLTASPNMG